MRVNSKVSSRRSLEVSNRRNDPFDRDVPRGVPAYRQALNPAWYRAGRKGHNTNETSSPGSPALWAEGFAIRSL
jgi:hypothetical protein